jgi:hypothetical protein
MHGNLSHFQEEIDTWLTATAGGDGDDGEADLPPSSLDPVGKRKRAAAAAEAGGRAAKVARSGANPLGTQLDEQVRVGPGTASDTVYADMAVKCESCMCGASLYVWHTWVHAC